MNHHRLPWILTLSVGLFAVLGAERANARWEFVSSEALANTARSMVETLSAKTIEPHQCPYHLVVENLTDLDEETSKQFHDAMTASIHQVHPEGEACMVVRHEIGGANGSVETREELQTLIAATGAGTVIEMSYYNLDAKLVAMARATSTDGGYRGFTPQIPLPARQIADSQAPAIVEKTQELNEKSAPAAAPADIAGRTLSIHGSPVLVERLIPDLARAFLKSLPANDGDAIVNEFSDDNGDHVLSLKDAAPDQIGNIKIRSNGAFQALDNLSAGRAHIVASFRPVTDAEHTSFAEKHGVDMRRTDAEHVVGLTGIEILVNQINDLSMVSRDTLRGIYSKKILNWQDPAVAEAKLQEGIKAIGPGAGSNATEILRTLIMRGLPPLYQSSLDWGGEIPGMIEASQNAIAFATAHLSGGGASVAIDECGHAYDFDPFAIKSLDHPLSVPLFLYVNPNEVDDDRDQFLDFVMSASPGQGQSIVDDHFTNLDVLIADDAETRRRQAIVGQQVPVLRNSHALFRMIIGDARRVSTTFRFRYDSHTLELDSYGQRAVERLVKAIRSEGIAADRVMLFGFADSQGEADYNLELAAGRARSVAQALQIFGLEISESNLFAIGEDAPIGCNLTSDDNVDEIGAARNRRVEVWITKSGQDTAALQAQ